MKKALALLTAALLLAGMTPCLAESGYLTIVEMRSAVPARLTETYATKWRDIAVDAEIRVPEVESLPVVLISGGAVEPTLTAEGSGWDQVKYRGPYDLILINQDPDYPKSVNGVRVGTPASEGVWYSGFAPENTYVPMDDTPFGDIVSLARENIVRFGYDPDAFELDQPRRLWASHVRGYGSKADLLPGFIYMDVRTKVRGIPVLTHILTAVESPSGSSRGDELFLSATTSVGYDGYTGKLLHLFLRPLALRETLADDIPLCSFGKVLDTVEAEINAGHIRRVYEIELGYVAYNVPGVYRGKTDDSAAGTATHQTAQYYLKPMWQVNCLYVDSPTAKLRDTSAYTDDERNSLDYHQLLIDAQTGELVRPSSAKDRCAFNGFLSWEDVR